jgi:hypothetical protein
VEIKPRGDCQVESRLLGVWFDGLPDEKNSFRRHQASELLKRFEKFHGAAESIQSYLWVTKDERCFESRDLSPKEQMAIIMRDRRDLHRGFSSYLNNWSPVEKRLGLS